MIAARNRPVASFSHTLQEHRRDRAYTPAEIRSKDDEAFGKVPYDEGFFQGQLEPAFSSLNASVARFSPRDPIVQATLLCEPSAISDKKTRRNYSRLSACYTGPFQAQK